MRVALSTIYRPPRAGPRETVERLEGLGAEAMALDPTLPEEVAEAIEGLPVAAVMWRGRARLCASEKDERAVAIAAAERAVRRAGTSGAGMCVVALGAADVRWDAANAARLFARDEWSPKRILKERHDVAARHLDAARFALERLIPVAERESARIGVITRATLIELPDAIEAAALLSDFRGAPIGYWHDTAAAHVSNALEADEPGAWVKLEPIGATAADACGLRGPLAPGLGEVDFAALALMKTPLVVIEGNGTDDEIRHGARVFSPKP
jgi:hypothetical protein